MTCTKCAGLMRQERYLDFYLTVSPWKCLNCGLIVDRTMDRNRRQFLRETGEPARLSRHPGHLPGPRKKRERTGSRKA